MAKIDCSVTVNFLREKERMCDSYGQECKDCALCGVNRHPMYTCSDYMHAHPDAAVEVVQKWSDEHPAKTRLDDLLEKYPNADIVDGRPLFYPARLGYCEYCDRCNIRGLVKECWNEPLVGGATGKAVE